MSNPSFSIEVNNTGWYVISMQVRSKKFMKDVRYLVTINRQDYQTVDVFYSDNWSSILVSVKLQQGLNTVAFSVVGAVMGEINSTDFFPQM